MVLFQVLRRDSLWKQQIIEVIKLSSIIQVNFNIFNTKTLRTILHDFRRVKQYNVVFWLDSFPSEFYSDPYLFDGILFISSTIGFRWSVIVSYYFVPNYLLLFSFYFSDFRFFYFVTPEAEEFYCIFGLFKLEFISLLSFSFWSDLTPMY